MSDQRIGPWRPLIQGFLFLGVALAASGALAGDVSFSGVLETQNFYLNPPNAKTDFSKFELQMKGGHGLAAGVQLKLNSAISSVWHESSVLSTPQIFWDQMGLEWENGISQFFVGGLRFHPEGPDLNNPFDIVQGVDFRNPFRARALGALGVFFNSSSDLMGLDLFYIPQNSKSLLPEVSSAWLPRTGALPISDTAGTFLIPENLNYLYRAESEIENPFAHNFGGQLKVSLRKIDLVLFYFQGASPLPQLTPIFDVDLVNVSPPVGTLRSPVHIDLAWVRSENLGLGLTGVFSDSIVKIFCKEQKDRFPLELRSQVCTYTYENSLSLGSASLRYFLQANRLWKEKQTAGLETLQGFYEKSLAMGFFLDLERYGLFSGVAIYNEKIPSTLTSISYQRHFLEQWTGRVGLHGISTSSSDLLALAYDRIDNVDLSLAYDF